MTWWTDFYDENLALLLLDQSSPAEIDQTLSFLAETLSLSNGDRIYDQCCGNGRLSIPLLKAGFNVVGVDQAELYIAQANQRSDGAGQFIAGDASSFVAADCDVVINWWTSWGYAETDDANLKMFDAAFRSLKPGGAFALDFLNTPAVIRHFQRHVVTRRATEDGDIVLTRESQLDLANGRILKRWTYFLPNGRRLEFDTSVKLYMPHRVSELMTSVGFSQIEFYGGTDSSALTADSQRCIVVARKVRV